jgi:hypothetical protein
MLDILPFKEFLRRVRVGDARAVEEDSADG